MDWNKLTLTQRLGYNAELIKGVRLETERPAMPYAYNQLAPLKEPPGFAHQMLAAALEHGKLESDEQVTFQLVIDVVINNYLIPIVALGLLFNEKPKVIQQMAAGTCQPNYVDRYKFFEIIKISLHELVQSPEAAAAPA